MGTETSTRVALVTGATGAIGQAIAKQLAAQPGFEVILACRNAAKAERAVAEIRRATNNDQVRLELVDVALSDSIRELGQRFRGPLHVLVNNAAIAPRQREVTTEGLERQFATNVLGYLRLTKALQPALSRAAPARVVNVASYWAGGLDASDLQFERRRYDNDAAYRQSKQANRMLTVVWSHRLADQNITVNACHPGDVRSQLSSDLGFGGHETAEQGARTPVWLATDDVGQSVTGAYFEHERRATCRFADDDGALDALANACRPYVD